MSLPLEKADWVKPERVLHLFNVTVSSVEEGAGSIPGMSDDAVLIIY